MPARRAEPGFLRIALTHGARLAVPATGPGRFSLDRLVGWDGSISGVWWGVGVLGASSLIGLATVTIGRHRPAPEQPAELRRAA